MQIPVLGIHVLWLQWTDSHRLWSPVEEKGQDGRATLSRGEHPDHYLDKLLLLFWASYIEDGPHLLCTGSL